MDPQAYQVLETQEMISVARHMYELTDAQAAGAEAEIRRIEQERWRQGPDIGTLMGLISKRARLYQTLSSANPETVRPETKYRKLLRNPEFSKVQTDIRRFERGHPFRFTDYVERIEKTLDPAKVAEAHRLWTRRASKLRGSIQLKNLFYGLYSRRSPAKPKQPGRSHISPSHSRPGGSKPHSGVAKPRPKILQHGRRSPSRPLPSQTRPSQQKSPGRSAHRTPAKPLNQWEKYVQDFIGRYGLSTTQTNAALSILKDLTSRAIQIDKSNQDRLAAAKKLTDAKQRRQRLVELSEPIDALFIELQNRLDGLLTAAQQTKHAAQKDRPSHRKR